MLADATTHEPARHSAEALGVKIAQVDDVVGHGGRVEHFLKKSLPPAWSPMVAVRRR
jgi:hypothetical protein